MKIKLRSLFPKRRGKKTKKEEASSTAKGGGSKLLDGVTVGVVVEPSPTADPSHGTDHYEDDDDDAAVSPVDTSIETTLDSLTDWLSDNDGSSSSSDGNGNGNGSGQLRLGPERTVVFHSPRNLGVQLHRGTDGRVRVTSLTPTPNTGTGSADPTLQGTVRTGDVVLEMAGTDLRQGPVGAAVWSRAVARVKKGTARPVTFVVAAEERPSAAAGTLSRGANSTGASKTTKTSKITVPTLEIEVDPRRADDAAAATASMDLLRTSDTWEMEQSKAEWVEAEKLQQLEEEKARLRMLVRGAETAAEANDDSIELVGIGDLRRMLDGAAAAVADMFGGVAPGGQSQDIGRIGSNPIDLDEVPSDLSSIAANGSVDNDHDGGGGSHQGKAADVEERRAASAKAEAARAALWKQAANKNNTNSGGQADDNDRDGDRDDADADADADLVRLNRINTAMFQRIDAKQRKKQEQVIVAREATGVSAATGLTTSGGTNASAAADMKVVREQSLTGSYTDVSENFMMESFLFLNRDDRGHDDDDDDDVDVDGGEKKKKEEMQAAGTPMANTEQNNNDAAIAAQNGDIFTEEDDYGNHYKISCGEHVINRIDDVVCSGAVCSALPEQFLLGGDEDDDDGIEEVEEEEG